MCDNPVLIEVLSVEFRAKNMQCETPFYEHIRLHDKPMSRNGVCTHFHATVVLLPDREEMCAGQSQGPLRTGSQGLPSRHTIGTSSPGTGHTTVKKVKKTKKIKPLTV